MKGKQVSLLISSKTSYCASQVNRSATSEFERNFYEELLKVLCNQTIHKEEDQHIGTLLLVALACQQFDSYENDFTYTLMDQYSPAQLTLAKSRVILTTETNMLLIGLLAREKVNSPLSDDDLDEIEEEIGYQLFKLDRQMNKLARKSVARNNKCSQVFVMAESRTVTLDVNFAEDTVSDLKKIIQVRLHW